MKQLLLLLVILFFNLSNIKAQLSTHVPNEVLIQFDQDVIIEDALLDIADYIDHSINLSLKKTVSKQANIYLISFDDAYLTEAIFLQYVKEKFYVIDAQFNHWLALRATPNDADFLLQWHWKNEDSSGNSGDVSAAAAWDISTGGVTANGDTIVIAMVDDGIDLDHPDLAANLWKNEAEIPNNDLDDDENGYIDDYFGWNILSNSDWMGIGGHGTSVAGMMGAVGNNEIGVTGINWQTKIMPIVGNIDTEAQIIECYSYALHQRQIYNQTDGNAGAFVVAINTSSGIDYGNPEASPLWCSFYDTLGVHGILSVASTANNDYNIDEVGDLPTACSSNFLISVTATDMADQRNFSAYGPIHVDLAAPGENVYTTTHNGSYGYRTGTSFAAPIITGQVALLYSLPCGHLGDLARANPVEAAQLVRDILLNSVDILPNLTNEMTTNGRANVEASLNLANSICQECPTPTTAGVTNISDFQVTLNAATFEATDTILWQWRMLGDTIWDEIITTNTAHLLTNLPSCTDYEYRVAIECNNETLFSNIAEFSTTGCCIAPENLTLLELTENTATFSWSTNSTPCIHEIQWAYISDADTSEWQTIAVTNQSTYTRNNLQPCSQYSIRIRTLCASDTTEYSAPLTITAKGCDVCSDDEYCYAAGSVSQFDYIDYVEINDLQNESGDNGGYMHFTELTTTLIRGETYTATAQPGFGSIDYEEAWAIWIDYNQDSEFTDEELIYSAESFLGTASGAFTIPYDALEGNTRLRIVMEYMNTGIPSPCESFTFGEIEDYCINIATIQDSPFCFPPNNVDTVEVALTSATFTWNANQIDEYQVQLRELEITDEWQTQNTFDNTYQWTNLSTCTNYEYRVGVVCANEVVFGLTNTFLTDCIFDAAINVQEKHWELAIYPTPATTAINIAIIAPENRTLEMTIHAANGQFIRNKQLTVMEGLQVIPLTIADLASGVYSVHFQGGTLNLMQRIIVVK